MNVLHESDVKELKQIISTVLKAYRIRLKLMDRRRNALSLMLSNHGDYLDMKNSKTHEILKNALKRERKILDIILKHEGVFNRASRLDHAISFVDSTYTIVANVSGRKEFIQWLRNITSDANPKKFVEFLKDVYSFLKRIKHSLKSIKARMELEEIFIAKADDKSFFKFLDEWEKEIDYNELLISDLNQILDRNNKMINKLTKVRTFYPLMLFNIPMGTVVGGVAGIFAVFMIEFSGFLKENFVEDKATKEVLANYRNYHPYRGIR